MLPSTTRPQRRGDGFTLLEVAFGLALLGLIGISVMATIVTCSKAQNAHREREAARQAARSRMEEVLAHSDMSTLRTTFDGSTFAADFLTGPGGAQDPPGRVSIVETRPGLFRVDVRVEWLSDTVGNHRFALSTFICEDVGTVMLGPQTGGAPSS